MSLGVFHSPHRPLLFQSLENPFSSLFEDPSPSCHQIEQPKPRFSHPIQPFYPCFPYLSLLVSLPAPPRKVSHQLLQSYLLSAKVIEHFFVFPVIVVLLLVYLKQLQEESCFRRSKSYAPRALLVCPEDISIRRLDNRRDVVELNYLPSPPRVSTT